MSVRNVFSALSAILMPAAEGCRNDQMGDRKYSDEEHDRSEEGY